MSFYIDPYYVASGWTAGRTHNPKDFPFISNQVESKEQNWLSFSCFSLRRFKDEGQLWQTSEEQPDVLSLFKNHKSPRQKIWRGASLVYVLLSYL